MQRHFADATQPPQRGKGIVMANVIKSAIRNAKKSLAIPSATYKEMRQVIGENAITERCEELVAKLEANGLLTEKLANILSGYADTWASRDAAACFVKADEVEDWNSRLSMLADDVKALTITTANSPVRVALELPAWRADDFIGWVKESGLEVIWDWKRVEKKQVKSVIEEL
jgi:hypothetical protein